MKPISFEQFNTVYQRAVTDIYRFWTPRMQQEIAAHCYGWSPERFDFKVYLQSSSIRFYRAYSAFSACGDKATVCDIGGFWGVFLIVLNELGFTVTMTEALGYYSNAFDELFHFISKKGVTVIDYDPFAIHDAPPGHFDIITVMALLEHYPHSLKTFMANTTSMLKKGGKIYMEVPNIAFWPKRMHLLSGRTPLVPLREIFLSQVPHIGHHHEFTIAELRDLVQLSGLVQVEEHFFNYSPGALISVQCLLRNPVQFLAFALLKDSRECLSVLCERQDGT